MKAARHDIAIAGGGLAGGLIALVLRHHRPDLDVVVVERGSALGGNHRWSWFASDLSGEAEELLSRLRTTRWGGGYDVCFPGRVRHLSTDYRSLASADFDAGLRRELPGAALRMKAPIAALDAGGITLADGERIAARAVIDCRGFEPSPHLRGGWQVFMGRHLRTAAPHRLDAPLIMDARVAQHGAYRFVYTLPLGVDELFVEDTYYADGPQLDRRALSSRIDAYCRTRLWDGEILGHETGVLPVITGGDFGAYWAQTAQPGVALAGARALFVHPLTSYTLPFAAETALAIAADADLPGDQLAAMLAARARRHWRDMAFYRLLGAMLFGAAHPDARYRVFERFYGLAQPLIERFYAGRTNTLDKARLLCGKPPVPIGAAVAVIAGRRQAKGMF